MNRPRSSRWAARARARPARTLWLLRRKARRQRAHNGTVGASAATISLSAGSGWEAAGATAELGDEAGRGSKRLSKRRSDAGMALILRWILRWQKRRRKRPVGHCSRVLTSRIQICISSSRDKPRLPFLPSRYLQALRRLAAPESHRRRPACEYSSWASSVGSSSAPDHGSNAQKGTHREDSLSSSSCRRRSSEVRTAAYRDDRSGVRSTQHLE